MIPARLYLVLALELARTNLVYMLAREPWAWAWAWAWASWRAWGGGLHSWKGDWVLRSGQVPWAHRSYPHIPKSTKLESLRDWTWNWLQCIRFDLRRNRTWLLGLEVEGKTWRRAGYWLSTRPVRRRSTILRWYSAPSGRDRWLRRCSAEFRRSSPDCPCLSSSSSWYLQWSGAHLRITIIIIV